MKTNQLIIIGAVVIVGALLFSTLGGLQMLGLQAYTTTNTSYYGGSDSIGEVKNKLILQGRGEITPQENYLSTWLYSGIGEKIILSPGADYWNAWWKGFLGAGGFNQPGVLIGRYWITATFNEGGVNHDVIWVGGFDNNYLEIAQDSPTYNYLYSDFGHFGKRPWGGLYGQYKNSWGGTAGTNGPTLTDGWNKWWSNPIMESYNKYTGGLSGTSVAFYMKSGRQGTMTVTVHGEYATWHQVSPISAHYDTFSDVVLQTDTFVVKSAEGDLDITEANVYKFLGGTEAGGTKEIYTKYVFQEGKEVKLNIDVDYSRPEMSKGWKVQIFKPGDVFWKELPIPDNQDNKIVSFTIPDGSFVSGGNNEWKVKLINPALQTSPTDTTAQAEIKLFVVDTYEHAPSDTLVSVGGGKYSEGTKVTIICDAYRNQITKAPITSFRIWGRLNQPRSGEYVFDTSITSSSITQSGEKFTGTYTFTVTKTGTIYVQAHAIDSKSYTGGEGLATILVTSAPTYSIVVDVSDSATGLPIQSATVTLGAIQKQTRSDGSATFDVLTGKYPLYVEKSGYGSYNGGILTIGNNMDIPVGLTLTSGGGTPGDGGTPGGGGGTTGDFTLIATVYDDSTWGAIAGAMVTVGDQSGVTDSLGQVTFSFNESKEYTITVTAQNYADYTNTVPLDTFQTGRTDAYMTPIEAGGGESGKTVVLVVTDISNGNSISGALISLGSASGVTDSDGIATFRDVADGSYDVIIQASGYETISDTATISGTPPIEISYQLTASTNPDDYSNREDPNDQTPTSEKSTVSVTITNGNADTIVKIDGATQYGASVSFLISSGTHTLTVGQTGYVVYTETITIPDKLSYTVTLSPIQTHATPGDVDGDGVPNSLDPDYTNEAQWYQTIDWANPLVIIGLIAVIGTIIGVAVIISRRKR